MITAAEKMDVPLVNTFMGGDAALTQDANWERALEIWPDIVRFAEDHGRKITIENCPMIFSKDEWPGGHNIAWSPYIWRRILETWGGTIGLNYDPSHLVWLMIDQDRFIREFGPHILHVPGQGPDDRPRRALRARHRSHPASAGRSRASPVSARSIGASCSRRSIAPATTGTASSSTRTATFEGTDELVKRGFIIAREILRPFVV